MEAVALVKEVIRNTKEIPKELIYEIDEGVPIYYRGYRDVLLGKLKTEDIMGSSKKQSFLIMQIVASLLRFDIERFYHLFSSELGVNFKKSNRAADIALISKERMSFDEIWQNHYSSKMPDIIIEVDTKADLTDMPDPTNYFFKKTQQLLNNGASKVIWIFTETETVMVAEQGKKRWEILPWTENVDVSHGFSFNILEIISKYKEK
jgi:Uma2 family endonuclease